MRNIFTVCIILAFVVVGPGCKKSATCVNETSVVGTWKLVETLTDPGDGSGRWEPAQAGKFAVFTTDNNIGGNVFTDVTTYNVVNSNTLLFTTKDHKTVTFRYHFKGSTLEINPPCYEACGLRFIRDSKDR